MLDKLEGEKLFVVCNGCGKPFTENLKEDVIQYVPEVNAFKNYHILCPICGFGEALNLEIPVEAESIEMIERYRLPNKEINQRKYIRDLQTLLTFENKEGGV